MARVTDCAGERLARDPGNRSLARRIDIRQNENIGLIERAAEFIPEMLRACIAMRLEKNEQAVELAPAGRLERGANLGRVMAVIVDHGDVVHDPLDVEPAPDAGKMREPFADQLCGHAEIQRDGSGRSGVAHVMHPRRMRQAKNPEVISFVCQAERTTESFELHVADD